MKKSLLIILLFVAIGSYAQLKVMTFNIRLNVSSDGQNAWPNRTGIVESMCKQYMPDIIGMQEVLPGQLADLKNILPEYTNVGVGREDGKEKGEFCPLFFKSSSFELIRHGDFGLSETPDEIGKKGWDAACERIATWAVLKDNNNEVEFLVLNTHLDHMGVIARLKSSELILAKIAQLAPQLPVILTGDFNAEPMSDVLLNFMSEKFYNSSVIAASKSGPTYTFHDFGRLDVNARKTIDYVLLTREFSAVEYKVITDPKEGFISDHHPVLVTITLK